MACSGDKRAGFLPAEQVRLVKTFTSTELADTSNAHRVEFGNIPRRDSRGRHGHLVGLYFYGTIQVDKVATTMTAAYAGENLFGLLHNLRLQAAGHPVLDGTLDGRRLRDDLLFRTRKVYGRAEDLADADATNDVVYVQLAYYFDDRVPGREGDAAIPLAALDHRKNADDVLSLYLRSALPGSPAGVTYDGFQSLQIFAIIRYEDQLELDRVPRLREKTTSQLSDSIEPEDAFRDSRLHYAVIRHLDEDSATLADYGNLSVWGGADLLTSGQDASIAQIADLPHYDPHVYERIVGGSPAYELDAPNIPLIPAGPAGTKVSEMGAAPVRFELSAKSTPAIRILHRQYVPWRPEERACILRSAGLEETAAGRIPEAEAPKAVKDVSRDLVKTLVIAPERQQGPI